MPFLLVVAAFVIFVLVAFGVSSPRVNLLALGLACYMLSILWPSLSDLFGRVL